MNIIGQRHKIVQQDIPIINTTIPDITDIPDGIKVTTNSIQNDCEFNNNNNETSTVHSCIKTRMTCTMIIDLLNDTIINCLPTNCNNINTISTESIAKLNDLTFQSIIAKYTLDFKQSVLLSLRVLRES